MPQVPTYQSGASLLGGARLSETDAMPFGAGVGAAVSDLGRSLQSSANAANALAITRKRMDADKWANDAMYQLRDYYSAWTADPENNSKETFAEDFQSHAAQSLAEWESKAPSDLAKRMFRDQFQRFSNSRYEAATITSARTRVNNLITSHDNQNSSIIKSYELDRSVPDLDANAEIMTNIDDRFASIDQSFGQLAPEKARELKAQLLEDAAYVTMNYSPATARKILKKGVGLMDGRRIHAIESQIETAESASRSVDVATVKTMISNRLGAARLGRQPEKFKLTDINLYLPDDKANALVNEANAQIDVFNTANQHIDKIKSWSGPEQVAYLQKLESNAGKDESTASKDADVLKFVTQQVAENVREYEQDPAGYLMRNNPAIKSVSDHIRSLSDAKVSPETIQQKMAERDALMLHFQGPPPPGASPEQYSIVNRSQVKVLSEAEAHEHIRAINESSPKEAFQTIMSVLSQHPGNEDIAFNNLVQTRSGTGLRGDYWLIYKNTRNPDVQDLVGAIQHAKSAKELSGDKIADYDKALDAYGPWRHFMQSFPGDNYQMEGMAAGIRSGVIAYAMVRSQGGKISPETAIRESVDKWVFGEMAPMSVNGQLVMIDRYNGKTRLTDNDAKVMGQNLELALRYIDPAKINRKDEYGMNLFPVIEGDAIGNESTRMEQFREIILNRGFFQPSADGKIATLYMASDSGTPFEVRDKNNRAIGIELDKLTDLHIYVPRSLMLGGGKIDITKIHDPLKPSVTIEGYERHKSDLSAWPSYYYTPIMRTNWPVAPKWLIEVNQ